jgi:heme/copper-type cytochrome/quinol oxidase subunit 2
VNRSTAAAAIVGMILLAASGIAIGYGFGTTVQLQQSRVTVTSTALSPGSSNSSSPYVLTLVITTNNVFNSTVGAQPAFFVLGSNGSLESSASISLPAHRLIELVIICYDNGTAPLTSPQYSMVAGTQNNAVSIVTNDNVNSSQGVSGIHVSGGQIITSLNASDIAHTFTIPQLGINIPIAPSSTVTAFFTINQTGTFTWFCEAECGSGAEGLQGSMTTPGWMTGNVAVS